jgi:hypothetical protein
MPRLAPRRPSSSSSPASDRQRCISVPALRPRVGLERRLAPSQPVAPPRRPLAGNVPQCARPCHRPNPRLGSRRPPVRRIAAGRSCVRAQQRGYSGSARGRRTCQRRVRFVSRHARSAGTRPAVGTCGGYGPLQRRDQRGGRAGATRGSEHPRICCRPRDLRRARWVAAAAAGIVGDATRVRARAAPPPPDDPTRQPFREDSRGADVGRGAVGPIGGPGRREVGEPASPHRRRSRAVRRDHRPHALGRQAPGWTAGAADRARPRPVRPHDPSSTDV